jgi:hypothetical protein
MRIVEPALERWVVVGLREAAEAIVREQSGVAGKREIRLRLRGSCDWKRAGGSHRSGDKRVSHGVDSPIGDR